MKLKPHQFLFSVCLALWSAVSQAEDIDIFLGGTANNANPPTVLIILDNAGNWNSSFETQKSALQTSVAGIRTGAVRLGLMMFSESGGGNTGTAGGYVRAAARLLTDDAGSTPGYRTRFNNLIAGLHVSADRSNSGKAGLAMMEAYRYLSGGAPIAGNNKNKTDYSGNTSTYNVSGKDISSSSRAVWALPGNALGSFGATQYNAPAAASTCTSAKTYIIYISNGAAQDSASDRTIANNALAADGGDITQISNFSPTGQQVNPADEIARFMHRSALNAVVYAIEAVKDTTGQGPAWTALLQSMVLQSEGKYFDVSSDLSQLGAVLDVIFTEIQSVNTSFASVSLPVSVNTQGSYLNQVYIGQFRTDPDGYPRWPGNLKQYRIGSSSTDLFLQDADGNRAVNTLTGFIDSCRRSYWTPTSTDTYWSFNADPHCSTALAASNSPDGPAVQKGGQAHRTRQLASHTARNVLTCSPTVTSCTSLTSFIDGNAAITQSALGATSSAERTSLINWARGADNTDENNNGNLTEMRPYVHGDVVHSRPVAIDYGDGTSGGRKVVVFYGANDGLFRAVNGNRDGESSIGTAGPGDELWAFAPPEFYGNFKRLRDNNTRLSFLGASGTTKPYGMDGAVTHVTSGSNVWIYSVMRRGGRVIYAFDVSTPQSPSLLWKVGCPNQANDTGCGTALGSPLPSGGSNWTATDFAGLGQTWSSMVPLRASGYTDPATSQPRPILITGGGYDTCEDTDTSDVAVCTAPRGRRIFVLDARTGAMLKSFTTDRGVVGDITVVNNFTKTSPGTAQYAYAADLGGNIYRINILTNAPADWTMTKIASLGCATTATCAPRRKFMYAPDVVNENGVYYVMVGSGDREKPLTRATQGAFPNALAVQNHFFAIKDDLGSLSSEATPAICGTGNAVICMNSLLPITTAATPSAADLGSKKGWYLTLDTSEQTVTSAVTLYGATTFSTSQREPASSTQCDSLGVAKVYNVSYLNAASMNGTASRSETLPAGGLPPSPVAGKVTLDNGETVPFVIGARPGSPLDAKKPQLLNSAGTNQPTKRVYRYIQK